MKKAICIICIGCIMVSLFCSCGSKLSSKEVVTDLAGEAIAPVTKEDGAAQRDDDGKLVVLVTNENGEVKKDTNGERLTESVEVSKALIIGDRIEMPDFSIAIPSGWSDNSSYSALQITKTKNSKEINLSAESLGTKNSAEEAMDNCGKITSAYKNKYENCRVTNKTVTLDSIQCQYKASFVDDIGDGTGAYMGFIIMDRGYTVMRFKMLSQLDLEENLDEYIEIFNSIAYVKQATVK